MQLCIRNKCILRSNPRAETESGLDLFNTMLGLCLELDYYDDYDDYDEVILPHILMFKVCYAIL